MYSKIFVVACIQFALFDVIASQCIRNIVPSCGCGCGGVDLLPNQVILNQPAYAANVVSGLAPGLCAPAFVNGLPATNIIQDNSVANNLANTLQLLLVSNLLSNTLPNSPELLAVPAYSPCSCGNGVSYIC